MEENEFVKECPKENRRDSSVSTVHLEKESELGMWALLLDLTIVRQPVENPAPDWKLSLQNAVFPPFSRSQTDLEPLHSIPIPAFFF